MSVHPHHLVDLGTFQGDASEGLPGPGTLTLLGPAPGFWPHFTTTPEYQDGAPNALDRWSTRVVAEIAATRGGTALFPFGGPPYHPFYTWALRSGRAFASPIGFLVHDALGLMISYRGAIFVPGARATLAPCAPSPCTTCANQPCRTACPVGAFDAGYDTDACHGHLDTPTGERTCMAQGCAARRACPIGQDQRDPAQSAFHMAAFHRSPGCA